MELPHDPRLPARRVVRVESPLLRRAIEGDYRILHRLLGGLELVGGHEASRLRDEGLGSRPKRRVPLPPPIGRSS